MRSLALLVIAIGSLAACDLQPNKQDNKSAVGATPPSSAPPAEPAGSGSAAGSAAPTRPRPPLMETTEECTTVATHIAGVVIESIEDPTVKAAQEQDRTKLVRRVAETCTRDKWSEAARKCFLGGKTAQELEVCGRALAAPSE